MPLAATATTQRRRLVESKAMTAYKVFLMLASIAASVFMTTQYHDCGYEWFKSIIYALGTSCVAFLVVVSLALPFMYWASTSKARDAEAGIKRGSYPSERIGKNLMPQQPLGNTLVIATSLGMAYWFTRHCRQS